MDIGDTVEIADYHGKKAGWLFQPPRPNEKAPLPPIRTGIITGIDEHCLSVRRDDTGTHIRDVKEHFRPRS